MGNKSLHWYRKAMWASLWCQLPNSTFLLNKPQSHRWCTFHHFTKPAQRHWKSDCAVLAKWPKPAIDSIYQTRPGQQPLFIWKCLSLQTMEEEISTTEDKTEVFMDQLEHHWMLWDPSDQSCKIRDKSLQITEDLGIDSPLFWSLRIKGTKDIFAKWAFNESANLKCSLLGEVTKKNWGEVKAGTQIKMSQSWDLKIII